ncbi:hypothetical protein AMC75_08745 [Staphylococcus carnosus]|uniref:hypothetical protein n=1 Tax=Staphylococcus carnosus TaxID=1281 RepID=UPI0006ABAC19|nr:hypothetical protein [Staphylococcus carnosus]KOR12557.1 hypothetical protein AMC75_08745 [Staphylococcus carnosus]
MIQVIQDERMICMFKLTDEQKRKLIDMIFVIEYDENQDEEEFYRELENELREIFEKIKRFFLGLKCKYISFCILEVNIFISSLRRDNAKKITFKITKLDK